MRVTTWTEAIQYCEQTGRGYVLVTVLSTAGSSPRNAGTKMVVVDDCSFDTIGGGHLEFKALETARQLLAKGQPCQHVEHYPLSSKLGQCCGGAMNLLFEVMVEHQRTLAIFGAGHVAKALIPIVTQLPVQLTWVDQRVEMFSHQDSSYLNSNDRINVRVSDDPTEELDELPDDSLILIMTHDHQLDFNLVENALKHGRFSYVGMIGSHTKARRFRTRLNYKGLTKKQLSPFVCPVGLTEIGGKRPIEVAVSITAQLIKILNSKTPELSVKKRKESWRNTKLLSKL